MPRLPGHGHLHRQHSARRQDLRQPSEQVCVIRRPLQGGVGQDQIDGRVRRPSLEIAQHPIHVIRQAARLFQHGRAGIQPMDPRLRPAPLQQSRVLPRAATDVPDLSRRQVIRQM
ncbi:hypothetical protein D3C73_1161280 [compost metagenome]